MRKATFHTLISLALAQDEIDHFKLKDGSSVFTYGSRGRIVCEDGALKSFAWDKGPFSSVQEYDSSGLPEIIDAGTITSVNKICARIS